MADLKLKTYNGGLADVKPDSLQELRNGLRGELVTPSSPDYDQVRAIWNGMIDRRPALIVRCATADDVAAGLRLARETGAVLAVRGGGHNIAGNAVCDGGLMIDLSPMRAVRVDEKKRTARVEAGATLGDVDRETQKFGLATPVGVNSTTGIAGLTLGGGFGWLSRKHGLTIDNLIAADVVTAAGERLRASATENPDLFWAIRGGGGNFGIVTAFEFRLHPVGPTVYAGLLVHSLDDARGVLQFYREFMPTTPEELSVWFVMRQAPPFPFLAPEWHGREILGLAVCWSGDLDQGEHVVKPLRSFGKPIGQMLGPMPFTAWQQILDPGLTPGARNYWKSHDFTAVPDGLIDALVAHARKIPDFETEIAFAQIGGAVTRVPQDATAYGHREAQYVLNVHGRWTDPAKDEKCIGWARDLFRAAAPFATGGAYMNFLTEEEGDRVRAAFGANYDRALRVKNTLDPTNLFRMNQNIRPSVTA